MLSILPFELFLLYNQSAACSNFRFCVDVLGLGRLWLWLEGRCLVGRMERWCAARNQISSSFTSGVFLLFGVENQRKKTSLDYHNGLLLSLPPSESAYRREFWRKKQKMVLILTVPMMGTCVLSQ